jgi:hypothetical protein
MSAADWGVIIRKPSGKAVVFGVYQSRDIAETKRTQIVRMLPISAEVIEMKPGTLAVPGATFIDRVRGKRKAAR